jgi:hypothetical protein
MIALCGFDMAIDPPLERGRSAILRSFAGLFIRDSGFTTCDEGRDRSGTPRSAYT